VQCTGTLISCGFIYLYYISLKRKKRKLGTLTNNFMGSTVTTENREEKNLGGGNEPMGASYGKLMMWFYRI
jgi:hypothetical protein